MDRTLVWRFLLIGVITAAALYAALPLQKKIKLGLDLQGGMHLVYEVQTEKAVEMTVARTAEDFRGTLEKAGITPLGVKAEAEKITIDLAQQSDLEGLRAAAKEFGEIEEQKSESAGMKAVYAITGERAKAIRQHAVDQALETLRNRIDQFGVSEPVIQRQGENRILIQLAGVKDPERAKSLIKTTARLEFRLVDEDASIAKAMQGDVPPHLELLYEYRKDANTGKTEAGVPLLVEKNILLGGESLSEADVRIDQQFNEPYVSIGFDSEGARRFGEVTGKYVKRRMAIVLDGKVHSAPVIREKIEGGKAQITGSFTAEQAHDLAIILRAGALPAPLELMEERSVGPSLGADSIRDGLLACAYGAVAVVLFMMMYYRVGGLIANLALTLNVVILAGMMGYMEATLTLPGIAGMALTIGIAVDANVLIYERLREELSYGKTIRAAVDAGFNRAFLTIIDTHVTTLITAIVLFQFGTGPLKGFAVTLTIGLLASLFTAVFVSRSMFSLILSNRKVDRISV
ncbi:MAG: protein translocase subunit SecD [Nitrospinae bacterium]|nr:protein translocase subunit SecD [Nitrospinota bacterium]